MKLLPAIVLVLLSATTLEPATQPDYIARLAPEIVARAHRFHGILVSYEDSEGAYFVRDGVRCRLFTEAFLIRGSTQ